MQLLDHKNRRLKKCHRKKPATITKRVASGYPSHKYCCLDYLRANYHNALVISHSATINPVLVKNINLIGTHLCQQ